MATTVADAPGEARLKTPHLVLRPNRGEDVERCVEILRAGGSYPARDHVPALREEVEHWREHGFGPWVALERETGEIVETIDVSYAGPGLEGIEPHEVEVGWMIDPRLWGRELATDGARAACDDALERVPTTELVAYVRPDKAASLRVAEKRGTTHEGDGRSRDAEDVRIFRLRR